MGTTNISEWCSTKRDVAVGMHLLSYGDQIAPGGYHLHSRFTRAVNFIQGKELLSFVDGSVGAGPLNVVVRELPAADFELVCVKDHFICVGSEEFALDDVHRYDSAVELPPGFAIESLNRGLRVLKETLRQIAPTQSLMFLLDGPEPQTLGSGFESALAQRYVEGCRLLKEGRYAEGARRIKGLGWGLTPSGDDFLCGLLIAWNLSSSLFHANNAKAIEEVSRCAENGNVFSTALLRCAKEGRVFERLKGVIEAVVRTNEGEIAMSARSLMSVGETSGADTATGLIFGLENHELWM
jgi:hypothetical protein